MKDILKANNIPQTKYVWFYKSDDLKNIITSSEKELSRVSGPSDHARFISGHRTSKFKY